ncbi:PKD domain-containing protein [bacterium]|nr:PKD domain-containing protein [bacterium]
MRNLLLGASLLLLTALVSCGGSLDPANGRSPEAQANGNFQPAAALPAPASLRIDADRDLSIAGPGWYDFDLQYRNYAGIESGVTENAGALDIAGAGGNGFCVFGLQGFDGDNFPTSLHAEVSGVTGQFYLAYTSYADGRWITAGPFSESTTHEYPEVSDYSDTTVHVSPRSDHFAAVLVPDGSALTLLSLAVGVDGGDEGPSPVLLFGSNSNADVVNLFWDHSNSFHSPDFAGYSIERSPFLGGESMQLTTQNIFSGSYVDATAEAGQIYLYRLLTWDTSGNSAASYSLPAFRQPGGTSRPICEVQMPKGPLKGPVDVTFDLSASYDNDGDAITQYDFDFGPGLGLISQPDPVLTVTLQPGCYDLSFTAWAGLNSSPRRMRLKVYPQWEQDSRLIDEGTVIELSAVGPRGFHDPQSDKVVFIYFDPSVPSVVSLTVDHDGNIDRSDMLTPFNDIAMLCSEPQLINGSWNFVLGTFDRFQLCTWTDNRCEMITGATSDMAHFYTSLVDDPEGSSYIIHEVPGAGADFDLMLLDLGNFSSTPLVTGKTKHKWLDAEWNPAAGAIDVVYSGGGTTQWLRWSPESGPLGGDTISATDSDFVDIELDPATGRPAVLLSNGTDFRYTQLQDDDSSWTAPALVDLTDPNWFNTKLVFRDGTAWCYIGHAAPGSPRLFRRDGVSWTNVNDAGFSGGGLYSTLTYFPSEPGFLVMDVGEDFRNRITIMQDNGDEEQIYINDGLAFSSRDLSAASSGSGIHLLRSPQFEYLHWFSPDGVTWNEISAAEPGSAGRIVADQNGEIYSSIVKTGTAYLRHWVDPDWVVVEDNPISPDTIPLVYGQGNALVFGNFDGTGFPEFHYKLDLDPSIVFQTEASEIWEGAIAGFDSGSSSMIVRYGGTEFAGGNVGVLSITGDIDKLFTPESANYGDFWTAGRHLEGASFTNEGNSHREVFYVTFGASSGFCRIWRNESGEMVFKDYPTPDPQFDASFYRRTVTATTAWGNTAVGMGAGLAGQLGFFEWSNYGDWEALPVPSGMEHGSLQELVVGPDGRWHIIYRDYVKDDLRIISTV